MGASKVSIINNKQARQEAMHHLLLDLQALEIMLDNDLFEKGVQRIGAEQELHFAGKDWCPAPVAMQVLEQLEGQPQFVNELALFNLEINLDPLVFEGGCLRQLEHDLYSNLKKVEMAARRLHAHAILVGVLPTIRRSDIDLKNITPLPRYKIMMDKLAVLRNYKFDFRIEGVDELVTSFPHPMFEATTASFQVHYQLPPGGFAQQYNWAQAITAPLVAAATNSPILLGRRLWRESRIALFQQSVDVRHESQMLRQHPPRVSFGMEWVKDSVLDIYRSDVARYQGILISNRKENALEVLQQGGVPKLHALTVHNGTIYKWNRPCYGITDGQPHLRIENRVLPSGPTIVDEVANAAFWLGMMNGMPDEYANISQKMEFDHVKGNFLRAAKHGLAAEFFWGGSSHRIRAHKLITKELLPIAKEGLQKANITSDDIDYYLGIVEERASTGRTGSQWLVSSFEKLRKKAGDVEALMATTAGLSMRQQIGQPVHEWHLADLPEAGSWRHRYQNVGQIMTTDLFTVMEDDLVEYVANIMDWRNIRHVPVENEAGEVTGLVCSKNLVRHFSKLNNNGEEKSVKDIMCTEILSIGSDTSIMDAITLLRKNKIGCLPIVEQGRLVGIVTETDFVRVLGEVMQEESKASAES